MAVSSQMSFTISITLALLLFSGMQANKQWISATPIQTIFGGFVGSLIFIFSLTAVGNLETIMFGKNFQTKLFPEVALCYLFTFISSAMVHRVCVTTALILSSISLYYMNSISQKTHAVVAPPPPVIPARKKKH
ncbi:protein KRTCAP2 homolog [Planococcus citri]|uniref:protein KRTCAP2 homolog n=1 Tax=Planococcus citri TaxID=170843 RepID=UPI0031F994B8